MQILDNPLSPPNTHPIWPTVFRHGLFCGLAFVLSAQIIYHAGIATVTINGAIISLSAILLISIATALFSIKRQKKLDGGYISFGKAAVVSSLSIYFGHLILNAWNYIFANYINPGYVSHLKEVAKNVWRDEFSREEMTEYLADLDSMTNFFAIVKSSFLTVSPMGIIAGLILAIFLSRKFKA